MDTPAMDPEAAAVPPDATDRILAELARLQKPEPHWTRAALVFLGTLFLFSAAGWARFSDPVFLGMLVGVLLFHEAGHFAAMRHFGYRAVRMFFIPWFGAAVSGRIYGVAGWKKAVVSLMGPLPGIIVGTGLLACWALWPPLPFWMGKLTLLLFFLNLFNLLPLQPFDGGQFLNTLFFCRNRWLEAGFRCLASVAMGWLAWKLDSKVLWLMAGFVLFTASLFFKTAEIANRLRGRLPEPEPGRDEIPAEAVRAIVPAVLARYPRLESPAQIAVRVRSVYDAATSRPPSAWACAGLLSVYVLLFFLPAAPFVALALHDPARFHAIQGRRRAAREERRTPPAESPGVRAEIPPIERRFPGLGPLHSVRWISENSKLLAQPSRPTRHLRGYARLGAEKITEFSTYPWRPAGPEFQPAFAILGNPAPPDGWKWCQPFTANVKPPTVVGELYFEPRAGLVYFDIVEE